MPADTSPLLSNNEKDAATADAEVEELDEADKELQRLADDRHDVNGSPPPTLNESRTSSVMSSERAGAPMPITAIATFKTLESPRSVVFTSSRPVSGVQSPATPPALAESPKAVRLEMCSANMFLFQRKRLPLPSSTITPKAHALTSCTF